MTNVNMSCTWGNISKYLEMKGQKKEDFQCLSSIFNDCDEFDDSTKLTGKDGFLNNAEWDKFIGLAGEKFTRLLADFKVDTEMNALSRAQLESAAPQDNTRVVQKEIKEIKETKETKKVSAPPAQLNKSEIAQKLYKKWVEKWPDSPLKPQFFEKLYDVIDVLNVKIPKGKWNKAAYSSAKEQAMDEVVAIFAGEAQLNPKSQNGTTYYGLFQLSQGGLTDSKRYAKSHPREYNMDNISQTMELTDFTKCSGEEQLDYLVAYINQCKQYSKIKKNESITPSQLWAMVKYPFNGKNPGTIKEKTDSISNVYKENKVPRKLT